MITIIIGIVCLVLGVWIGRCWANWATLKFMDKIIKLAEG